MCFQRATQQRASAFPDEAACGCQSRHFGIVTPPPQSCHCAGGSRCSADTWRTFRGFPTCSHGQRDGDRNTSLPWSCRVHVLCQPHALCLVAVKGAVSGLQVLLLHYGLDTLPASPLVSTISRQPARILLTRELGPRGVPQLALVVSNRMRGCL